MLRFLQICLVRVVVPLIIIFTIAYRADIQPIFAQDQPTKIENYADKTITVGSKEYTEQLLLGQMFVLLLEHAGYNVVDKTGLGGSPVVRSALENGAIDLYPELTGTALSVYYGLPSAALPTDPDRAYTLIQALDKAKDIVWLNRGYFNNTYTMMIDQELRAQGLETLEDLAIYIQQGNTELTVCVETEFYGRLQDGLHGMESQYKFIFMPENIQVMALDETYDGLRDGSCDVAEGFSTDGRISAWNFHNLEDTLSFFPFYNVAPVTRQDVLNRHPGLPDILNPLGGYLDNEAMSVLNARVDLGEDGIIGSGDEESVEGVAKDFLQQQGLLSLKELIVGSKEYTEQLILGKMLYLLLKDSGYPVIDKTGTGGSPVVRKALEEGEIDLYFELTGTALSVYHDIPATALPKDPNRAYELIKNLDQLSDIIWLDRGTYNNTYTLMVKPELYADGLNSLDDLAAFMNANDAPLTLCVESEFYARLQDGLSGMEQEYNFAFRPDNVLVMDLDQSYDALRDGTCDVAEGFSTDGRISAWGFHNLEDTRRFFPFYNPAPVTRQDILETYPELADRLNQLSPYLDNEVISALNARVDIGTDGKLSSGDEEAVEDVARDFLQKIGLIRKPIITVGSKEYTEQLILGQMYIQILQDAGYETVDMTGLGGSPLVRSALVNGEIDLYPELNGTALSVYHEFPSESLPKTPEQASELARILDEPYGFVWLQPGLYNNTYTLMVQQGMVDEGILTIEDLATFMNTNDAPFTLCVEGEFFARQQDGLSGLQERYDFRFKEENILVMDLDKTYDALRDGRCDVAEGFSTDGRIKAWGFHNLQDTLAYFPFYNISPVIREDVLKYDENLSNLLNPLGPLLDDPVMISLNALVDIGLDGIIGSGDEEEPGIVARNFLCLNGLLKNCNKLTKTNQDSDQSTDSGKNTDNTDSAIQNNAGLESDIPITDSAPITTTTSSTALQPTLENRTNITNTIVDILSDTLDDKDLDTIENLVSSLTLPPLNNILDLSPLPAAISNVSTTAISTSTTISTIPIIPTPIPTPIPTETSVPTATPPPTATPAPTPIPVNANSNVSVNIIVPGAYSVNVRETADLEAEVLGVLPRGAILQAIGRTADNKWLQVILQTSSQTAWVFKDAIFSQPSEIAQLPIVTAPLVPE